MAKGKILIVDDEAGVRGALKRYLKRAGYLCFEAANGIEAETRIEEVSPDLMIMDVLMPERDGFETLEVVRKKYSDKELPILMATALDQTDHVIRAMRLGANDYTVKPFDMKELFERIDKNIRKTEFNAGDAVDDLEIMERIGTGGAGNVYRAKEAITERVVAMKVLNAELTTDEEFVARFLREARTAASIHHPNVVGIYSAGRIGDSHYIVMELIEGEDLFAVANRLPMPTEKALEIADDISAGLEELHKNDIIHRDIKPENILISVDGRAVITDFGLARTVFSDEQITTHGMAVGTLPYISPEQLLGKVDKRSDLYSLGATLFFALVGEPPFSNTEATSDIIRKKFLQPPLCTDFLPDLPKEVSGFVASLMATEADDRPQDFSEVRTQLKAMRSKN
ncbi:MAG: protein kinase [Deltaproteobacteria bacterium]|nr:protein kinase [Deltaproteobacteria bacterium]